MGGATGERHALAAYLTRLKVFNSPMEAVFHIPKLHSLHAYGKRMICAGNVYELYEYEKPVIRGDSLRRRGRANAPFTSQETRRENRSKVARRARSYVLRMVNANPQLDKFLTLTFSENVTDVSFARLQFDRFLKRLRRQFLSLQFISVIEFQKRGAVHFHLLCNLPYVNVNALAEIWRHGFIKLNRIDTVDNVGAYVTKYMTKDGMDERLIGRRSYTMSRGLHKPCVVTDEQEINERLQDISDVVRIYTAEYETEYYGVIKYTQLICKRERLPQTPQQGYRGVPLYRLKKRRGHAYLQVGGQASERRGALSRYLLGE